MKIFVNQTTNSRKILAGVILLSIAPFLAVEVFYPYLYFRMNSAAYLVFHNSSEIFSILVSMSIFGLGWFSYDQSKDQHVLFLSAAFLTIGLMDFMHTLGYAGMPSLVTANSPNKSTQFWIAVRFFSAAAFLFSGFVYADKPKRWLSKLNMMVAALVVSGLVFTGIIFFQSYMPETFVEGEGLTPFKKISEYVIICLLVSAFAVYWRRMMKSGNRTIIYYLAAFILCILSELTFAVYSSVFDTYNVLGHIYKIIAFYLIYKGIFVNSINIPYKKLIDTNAILEIEVKERKRAEDIISQSLREKETLIRELYHRTKNTMQVIMGMIVLKSIEYPSNTEIQKLVKSIDCRVQAISLVHQMLYNSQNLSQISIRDYITRLAALIIQDYKSGGENLKLEIDVDDQWFLLDTAIPFGLILNELLTNTLKYAFPDNRKGIISISLKRGESGENILQYSDNGIGTPDGFDFRNNNTLGLKLIHDISEQQMLGRINMMNNNGVFCLMEFHDNLYQARV